MAAVIGHARRVIDRLLVSIASLVVIETLAARPGMEAALAAGFQNIGPLRVWVR